MSTFSVLCYLALLGLACSPFASAQADAITSMPTDNSSVVTSAPSQATNLTCLKATCSDLSISVLSTPACQASIETCGANTTTCISVVQYTGVSTVGKASITLGCAAPDMVSQCDNTAGKQSCTGTVNRRCVTCCKSANCNVQFTSAAPVQVAASLPLLAAVFIASFLMH